MWSHAGLRSGDAAGHPDAFPTESVDGTPHLTYFADDTSFVWSGDIARPIQVCPGGYGEAVTDEIWPIDVPALANVVPAGWTLAWALCTFRAVCDQWLRETPTTETGDV